MIKVYLNEMEKCKVIYEPISWEDGESFIDKMWPNLKGNEWVDLTDGMMHSVRKALLDKPLTDWEKERIDSLKSKGSDIQRHGDNTLFVRGLIKESEGNKVMLANEA